MKRLAFAALAASAAITFANPAAAQGGCDRVLTQEIADSWIAALEQGTMMTMNLGEWVDYNENFQRKSLGGFLDHPREVLWSMSLLDTTSCKVYVEAVTKTEDGKMEVLALGDVSTLGLVGLLGRVYLGRHLGHPQVKLWKCQTLTLEPLEEQPGTWSPLLAEGDNYSCAAKTDFAIKKAGLSVLVPADAAFKV